MSQPPDAEVSIERLAFGGDGVGHLPDGRVVFVQGALPGELARVQLLQQKKSFARGRAVELLRPHPQRQAPACPVAERCGGCQFWAVPYAQEWAWTSQAALEAMERASGLQRPAQTELFPAHQDRRYRRRVRLRLDAHGRTGFYAPGTHRLVPLQDCLVAHPALLAARDALAPALPGAPGSLLLELDQDQRSVAAFWETRGPVGKAAAAARRIFQAGQQGPLRGVRVVPLRDPHHPHKRQDVGDPSFSLRVDGIERRLQAGAFTQAHGEVNEALVQWVTAALAPDAQQRILELYCGAGNFSLGLLARGAQLHGVEFSQEATEAAAAAAGPLLRPGQRADFTAWDLRQGLPEGLRAGDFTSVLLDPPRSGAREVMEPIAALRPGRVVYVSCDPPTLGRDLKALAAHGWALRRLSVWGMFPRTWHVEMAAVLEPT